MLNNKESHKLASESVEILKSSFQRDPERFAGDLGKALLIKLETEIELNHPTRFETMNECFMIFQLVVNKLNQKQHLEDAGKAFLLTGSMSLEEMQGEAAEIAARMAIGAYSELAKSSQEFASQLSQSITMLIVSLDLQGKNAEAEEIRKKTEINPPHFEG